MFNVATFKRIVSAATLAGLLTGLLLTGVQEIQIKPMILKAEAYEDASAVASHAPNALLENRLHEGSAWRPANGFERTLFSAIGNVSLAIGFALLLGAALSFQGEASSWRAGLLWGSAGYIVFFVAPSISLPPTIPGTEAAALANRQTWWLATVVMTATGLSVLIFARTWHVKLAGLVLVSITHLVGAPHPQINANATPTELAYAFIYATALANAVFWLALGSLTGLIYRKLT